MNGRLSVDLVDERSVHLRDFVGVAAVAAPVAAPRNLVLVGIGVVFSRPIGRAGGQLASQIPVADFLPIGQIVHDVSDPVDGDGKAGSFHVCSDGRVDADDPAALHIDQGTACVQPKAILNVSSESYFVCR